MLAGDVRNRPFAIFPSFEEVAHVIAHFGRVAFEQVFDAGHGFFFERRVDVLLFDRFAVILPRLTNMCRVLPRTTLLRRPAVERSTADVDIAGI